MTSVETLDVAAAEAILDEDHYEIREVKERILEHLSVLKTNPNAKTIYGSMDGEVITISPDATVEERTGESHYTVRVRTYADTLRDRDGHKLAIGPGMTADVNLLGDKRSILAYLLTPLTRLQETAFRE